jgi:cell division protein FtsQ
MSGSRVTTSRRPAATSDRFTGRTRRRRLRGVLSWFLALLTVAAIGVGVWLVNWSDMTALETLRVEGAAGPLAEHVAVTADAPIGEQLIWVDTDAIAARVGELPEFAAVSVRRSWPRTLVVSVRQRVAAATVRDGGSWWLVDRSGVQFGRANDKLAGLPVLDAPAGDDAASTRAAGVAVLTTLPRQLQKQVETVSAHSPTDVRMTLSTGAAVLWGGPDDSADKATVLLTLLGTPEAGDATTYDVSAPSRPAITP